MACQLRRSITLLRVVYEVRRRRASQRAVFLFSTTFSTCPTMPSLFPNSYPHLPDFSNLLIYGPYHASAPIHLCLSHAAVSPANTAVLIAPSRSKLRSALQDFQDEWSEERGGLGATSQLARRIEMMFVLFPLIDLFTNSSGRGAS